jgi:kynurenine formamidase
MLSPVFNAACQVIDLSHAYSAAAPHYPGDRPIERQQAGMRARDGFLDYRLDMAEHCGTHLDAPLHFAENGLAVDGIPLARLMGPLVVIDISVRAQHDPDAQVEMSDIADWTRRHGALPPGAIMVMRSGWSARWNDAARYFGSVNGSHHSPGWSLAAVTHLIEKTDAVGIGVDTAPAVGRWKISTVSTRCPSRAAGSSPPSRGSPALPVFRRVFLPSCPTGTSLELITKGRKSCSRPSQGAASSAARRRRSPPASCLSAPAMPPARQA